MPRPTARADMLGRLKDCVERGQVIVGSGAGIGLTAKCVDQGGADMVIIYNSGRYRMAGLGSLAGLMPYGNANDIVLEMAREVVPMVQNAGVLAGVCASDPFHSMPALLGQLQGAGVCGVQNFPTVGLIDADSRLRANLEETGMGYGCEVELVRTARGLDLLTTPYAFNADEAAQMARAGADVVVAHMGLTSSGAIGARSGLSLDESVGLVQQIRDAAVAVKPDVLVLCHGGPIAMPDDARFVLARTKGVHGFYGASSMERLPVETAVTENAKRFKDIKINVA